MKKRVVAIIQARMNSRRLPGKMMMDIAGLPAIHQVYKRIQQANVDEIIVATTTNVKDLEIINYLNKNQIKYYVGSEKDVLKRVHDCALYANADIVVEITGDCPLIDYRQINALLDLYHKNDDDIKLKYVSNCIPTRAWPDGFDIQVYDFELLKYVQLIVEKERHRQHVGWNIHTYFNGYEEIIYDLLVPLEEYWHPEIGLTLDTKEDLEVINKIFKHFEKDQNFTAEEAIDYVLENPEILKINENVVRKTPGEGLKHV